MGSASLVVQPAYRMLTAVQSPASAECTACKGQEARNRYDGLSKTGMKAPEGRGEGMKLSSQVQIRLLDPLLSLPQGKCRSS